MEGMYCEIDKDTIFSRPVIILMMKKIKIILRNKKLKIEVIL